MSGPDKTGLFLLLLLGLTLAWEAYAVFWLEEGSAISQVLGKWLRSWPPLLLVAGVVFTALMIHFWDAGE